MAVVNILQYPDSRLKRTAQPVVDFGAEFQQHITDMRDTFFNADNCAALAATQLDLDPGYHVTVIDLSPIGKDELLTVVNGEITYREGIQNETEGCMSVGCDVEIYIHAKVERAMKVTLHAQDRYGEPFTLDAEGFLAKCIQHELDHLEGKIFLDRVSSLKRSLLEKKLFKEHKRLGR